MNKLRIAIQRAYHRWRLRNVIAYYNFRIVSYSTPTNGFIVESVPSGKKFHVFVDAEGKIRFIRMKLYK